MTRGNRIQASVILVFALLLGACSPSGEGSSASEVTQPNESGNSATSSGPGSAAEEGTPPNESGNSAISSVASDDPDVPWMDSEMRHQVLDEVGDYVVSVSSDDRNATREAIVEYLRSRPEFAEAGVSDGGVIWGVFTDGGLYFHADNRFPHWDEVSAGTSSTGSIRRVTMTEPAIALPAALQIGGSAGAELPRSAQATVLDALGPQGGDVTESVAAWLDEAGYKTTLAEGTIERLRTVSGDGVFLFNGHGGVPGLIDPALADTYALFSTTELDTELETGAFEEDLQAGRIGWGSIDWDNNPAYAPDGDCEVGAGEVLPPHCRRYNLRTVYALTTAGIEEYWSFAENALVALGSCTGATLANTIHHLPNGGTVGAFVGFTEIVTYGGGNTMLKFFFDRMLGRNKMEPVEWPDLRPFDADSVGEYMERIGKAVDSQVAEGASVPARLLVADVGPTVLVPSIGTMEVHEESNELFIDGMFGSESDTIEMCPNPNATACPSLPTGSWEAGMVVGKVEDEGPASAGWVRVVVDGRMSNLVPLTEWRGQIKYRASADALAPNLLNEMSLTVHLRADVHMARERPWDEPKSRTVEIEAVGDSWGSWSASGSSSQGGGTFTLKGSGDMPVGEDQPDHEGAHFLFIGTLVVTDIGAPPELVDVNIHAHLSSDPEATLTIEAEGLNRTTGFPLLLTDVLFGRDFDLDIEYDILEGEVESSAGVGGTPSMGPGKLSWDEMDAKHAPDVNDPPPA